MQVRMETKELERTVITKPVATRPTTFSTFKSFSELLAGAINDSTPKISSEGGVAPIKPKTVRFKPAVNRTSTAIFSSQAEISGTAICNSVDTISNSDSQRTVVYKPLAKPVSKAVASLLANIGNFNATQPAIQPSERPTPEKRHVKSKTSSNLHQITPLAAETKQTSEPLKLAAQDIEEDQKALPSTASVDRPSYDGYNWRKYGQKQVKGSEYPRSYYKCTHPNCPVKKKVERSLDGQIAEIVYKGEHNHLKPQPPKRSSSGMQGLGTIPDGTEQDNSNPFLGSQPGEKNEGSLGRVENQTEVGLAANSSYQGKGPIVHDPTAAIEAFAPSGGTPDSSCNISGAEDGSKAKQMGNDEPRSKRRRTESGPSEAGNVAEGVQEPCTDRQNSTDSEILGDGFRWRKYGQKVVKGNPYPRSYYRCTSLKCSVRKYVERAMDDPKSFITTYEGKHNHEMPLKGSNPADHQANK
ncbi:hypothetical protein BT93_K0403 [Corymbia citriodora subsp. variegata]|nr:hypothetical protein BT93_K0403 [Corymbia citriodora subsp. variegata]KAF8006092.1 hypothetical protein BT93_K0403 [Corymbia citriodora subsp. variegata]